MKFSLKRGNSALFGVFMVIIFFSPFLLQSQQLVEGVVIDRDGKPIKNVEIVFIDKDRGTKFTLISDKNGKFIKVGIPPAYYIILVEHEGYYPLESEFKVDIGRNPPLKLILEKKPVEKETDPDLDLGRKFYQEGNYDKAADTFRKVLKKNPNNIDANFGLALSLLRKKEIDKAILFLEKVKQSNPSLVEVYLALGESYFLKKEADKALSYFYQALKIEPDNAEVFYNLGIIHYQNDQVDEAIQNLLTSKKLDPQFTATYYQLGLAYIKKGETDKAVENLKEFLRREPDSSLAPKVKNILKALKDSFRS